MRKPLSVNTTDAYIELPLPDGQCSCVAVEITFDSSDVFDLDLFSFGTVAYSELYDEQLQKLPTWSDGAPNGDLTAWYYRREADETKVDERFSSLNALHDNISPAPGTTYTLLTCEAQAGEAAGELHLTPASP